VISYENKSFDAAELQDRAAQRLYEQLKGLTLAEQFEFWQSGQSLCKRSSVRFSDGPPRSHSHVALQNRRPRVDLNATAIDLIDATNVALHPPGP